jgi:phosphatidylglycerophosphate synthase
MLAWWALTCLMLDWHLGMFETDDGRPRPLGPADALTLSRAWLAPAVLESPGPALAAAGFATDVLDGVAARSLGEPTRAGRDLEGLADACFAAALLAGLRRRHAIGPAASAAELTRLGAGFSYSLAAYFGRAEPPDRALTLAARPTTVLRAGGLIAAAAGRRRLGTALVAAGCAASVALMGRALRG